MINKEIIVFIGTTAELIKLAPVIKEFKKRKIAYKIITSRQNPVKFGELTKIIGNQKVYHTFRIRSGDGFLKFISSHSNKTISFGIWAFILFCNMYAYFKNKLKKDKNKKISFLVHGDTVSALLGACISKLLGMRLIHIESGLRSYRIFEPFPEEICRFVISYLTDIHFCPNEWAVNNLKNHSGAKINTKENTLYESCIQASGIDVHSKCFKKIGEKRYFILVLHRQEHLLFKKNLAKKYLRLLTSFSNPRMKCLLVMHSLTRDFLRSEGLLKEIEATPNIVTVSRLQYFEFIKLLTKADFIATDGGSNQEEAYFLGKPCLILRNVTERIEGLGENAVLAKASSSNVKDFLDHYERYKRDPIKALSSPSKIIVNYLSNNVLKNSDRVRPYTGRSTAAG